MNFSVDCFLLSEAPKSGILDILKIHWLLQFTTISLGVGADKYHVVKNMRFLQYKCADHFGWSRAIFIYILMVDYLTCSINPYSYLDTLIVLSHYFINSRSDCTYFQTTLYLFINIYLYSAIMNVLVIICAVNIVFQSCTQR